MREDKGDNKGIGVCVFSVEAELDTQQKLFGRRSL